MPAQKYPGNWVVAQLLEGKMGTHREWVKLIAEQIHSTVESDSDRYVNRFTVPSTTSSSVYLVSQRRTSGEWCCSCRGWITHRHCKHLDDILQRLAAHAVLDNAANAQATVAPSVVAMLASARDAYSMLSGIS
jgi:hypothetical protein